MFTNTQVQTRTICICIYQRSIRFICKWCKLMYIYSASRLIRMTKYLFGITDVILVSYFIFSKFFILFILIFFFCVNMLGTEMQEKRTDSSQPSERSSMKDRSMPFHNERENERKTIEIRYKSQMITKKL